MTQSTTHWIREINAGNRDAAQELWERYYGRLVAHARKKLFKRTASDEEDVAISAFKSFCLAAEAGRFPDLKDSENLWRLLITIVARKAGQRNRYENRQCRSSDKVAEGVDLDLLLGSDPTPEFVVETIDTCRRLLEQLGTEELRRVAILKMQGNTNQEIGAQLNCSLSSVERKLRLIRRQISQDP